MINFSESFVYPPYCISTHMQFEGCSTFKLYDFQERLVNHININQFTICLSSRDMGITNTILATLLWHLNYRPNITIAISGANIYDSRRMFEKFVYSYSLLPFQIRCSTRSNNNDVLTLANQSKLIIFDINNINSIKGNSIDIMFFDDFSRIDNPYTIWNNIFSSIMPNRGKLIIASSAAKKVSLFHDIWIDAKNNLNNFKPIEFRWHDHPHRDLAWKMMKLQSSTQYTFDIEHENLFY